MSKYLLYILLAIVLAVLPSLHIIPALEIYDEKRIFQIGLLVFVGLFYVGTRLIASLQDGESDNNARPYVMNSVATWGIAFFMLLGIVSTWLNGGWYHGLQELSLYVLLLVFMLFTAQIYLQQPVQFEKGIGLLLLLFGGLYVLKFFIGYGMHLFIDYPLWPGARYQNTYFGFSNMRFLNQVQVWSLPLLVLWGTHGLPSDGWGGRPTDKKEDVLIHPSDRKPSVLMGYLFLFLAAFWACLIVRTASEGAILCLFVAPFITLWLFEEQSHDYIKKYLGTFLTGILLKFVLFDWFTAGGIAEAYGKSTGMGRLSRWGKMINDMIDQPLAGYGPMQFANMGNQYSAAHPHNSVLQIGYEFGIPAMVIAVGLVCWGLYRWFHQYLKDKPSGRSMLRSDNIRIGVSTSLLAGLGYSLFSGVMVMPLSQLWMALVGGWALGIYISDTTNNNKGDLPSFQNSASLMFKGVVIAAIVFMSYSMIRDVPKLKENQKLYQELNTGSNKYHPRFWQQGKIGRETL